MASTPGRKRAAPKRKKPAEEGKRTPVRYSRPLASEICERIAAGESWRSICSGEGMPAQSALYQWRERRPDFAQALSRAREIAAEACADRALEVAEASSAATLQADRLRVSTLLWHAARGAPRRQGGGPAASDEPRRIIVEVRDFVPVIRPDGTVFTREILPDGSYVDDE